MDRITAAELDKAFARRPGRPMSARTLRKLERITAHTATATLALTVTAWAYYIATGGLNP